MTKKFNTNGHLSTILYDKRDDFNFATIHCDITETIVESEITITKQYFDNTLYSSLNGI
jgi:hypothetical protein